MTAFFLLYGGAYCFISTAKIRIITANITPPM